MPINVCAKWLCKIPVIKHLIIYYRTLFVVCHVLCPIMSCHVLCPIIWLVRLCVCAGRTNERIQTVICVGDMVSIILCFASEADIWRALHWTAEHNKPYVTTAENAECWREATQTPRKPSHPFHPSMRSCQFQRTVRTVVRPETRRDDVLFSHLELLCKMER